MSIPRERVFITGAGVRSAIGDDVASFWSAICEGRSGVSVHAGDPARGLQPYVAATAAVSASELPSKAMASQTDRVAQLSWLAAMQALGQAGLSVPMSPEAAARLGVYWGTGMGGAGALEAAFREFYGSDRPRLSPMTVIASMANASAGQLSIHLGARGPMLAVSNACSSSAQAIGEALYALRAGRADCIVAGGSEALVTPGVVRAWQTMGVLATPRADDAARSCRPFDAQRTGLVLGEGAAAFVLETESHLRARGGVPLAELAGYGCSSDAVHMAKPDVAGQCVAMRQALADAGVLPTQVGYVNAHGTATPTGDPVEVQSLAEVFGVGSQSPWIGSTKALHGHTLGAAGAIELLVSLLALRERRVPPSFHADEPIDLPRLAREGQPNAWPADADAVLSNSFAFGGFNAVLILREAR